MRPLGLHTSIAGGLPRALERAHALGCTTLQLFTHNPRAWRTSAVTPAAAESFRRVRRELGLDPVFVHASYLINVASVNPEVRERSTVLLAEEMERADALGADYVVLHPGSAPDGAGERRAAAAIRSALGGRRFRAGLLLENTAGRRGDIASGPAALGRLMDAARGLPAGMCLDTCHAFSAGFRLGQARDLEGLAEDIKRHVGTDAVRLVHLNDSRTPSGSRRDRHEHLGQGTIGLQALRRLLHHPLFARIPVVLETPVNVKSDDVRNLRTARRLLLSA